jgi:monofunctional biosynthetic peptidoglycan transglycosylase
MRIVVRLLRWLFWAAVACSVVLAALFAYDSARPPVSMLMLADRLSGQSVTRAPVPLGQVSPNLVSAVLMSEDAQFCSHHGVDWDALHEVMSDPDGPSRGASTITMQTAKNLFLWPGRSYIRKGLEIPMALILDAVWSKRQILDAYLNVAEWGVGIFGVEAAARFYFRKPAGQLTGREAALLASALPNPRIRNPVHPTRVQREHVATILARMKTAEHWLGCTR